MYDKCALRPKNGEIYSLKLMGPGKVNFPESFQLNLRYFTFTKKTQINNIVHLVPSYEPKSINQV